MKRPRITPGILEGIIGAVECLRAGGFQEHEDDDVAQRQMEAASDWAADM